MASDETRDSLLDAAKRVVQRDGAANLTLEAVAKEAGVSKGGLLYHFPSKSDLLRGVVRSGGRNFRDDLQERMRLESEPMRFARALLRLNVFGPDPACKPPASMVWSLLVASANDPSLLSPIQETHSEMAQRLLDDGIAPEIATLIQLVGRGLWMTELFGFDAPDGEERQRLHDLLSRLAGLDGPSTPEDMEEK